MLWGKVEDRRIQRNRNAILWRMARVWTSHCLPHGRNSVNDKLFSFLFSFWKSTLFPYVAFILSEHYYDSKIAGRLTFVHRFKFCQKSYSLFFFHYDKICMTEFTLNHFFKITLSHFKGIIHGIKYIYSVVQSLPLSLSRTFSSSQTESLPIKQ